FSRYKAHRSPVLQPTPTARRGSTEPIRTFAPPPGSQPTPRHGRRARRTTPRSSRRGTNESSLLSGAATTPTGRTRSNPPARHRTAASRQTLRPPSAAPRQVASRFTLARPPTAGTAGVLSHPEPIPTHPTAITRKPRPT